MRDEILKATKEAMKSRNELELSTLRLMNAAIKELDIEARSGDPDSEEVNDQIIMSRFATMIKQRRESAAAYKKGGRADLAERELQEIKIIEGFLPRQLDEAEIQSAVDDAMDESGAESIKDMGKVMAVLKSKFTGQMDFAQVSNLVKQRLSDM